MNAATLVLNYGTKAVERAETPAPAVAARSVLVHTLYSAISVGTESMMYRLSQQSLLVKARSRPDLALKVLHKARTEGVGEAWRQAAARLQQSTPLGYSSAGVVLEAGREVEDLRCGDLVSCAGQNIAPHAARAHVPRTMCAKVPRSVATEQAAFAGVAAVALNAVRMSGVELGGVAAVVGLGLIGQLAVRLLAAAGVRVFACDPDPAARARANVPAFAEADALAAAVRTASGGQGADAALLCAAGGRDLLHEAAECCRLRAKVVAVGATPLAVPRREFYEKELSLIVSRSFGPGVYESEYEAGADYPLAHVRWTVRRNMEAFLALLESCRIDLTDFVDLRIPFETGQSEYENLIGGRLRAFGPVFVYPPPPGAADAVPCPKRTVAASGGAAPGTVRLAFIGAGAFARSTLLPELAKLRDLELAVVCSRSGEQAAELKTRYRFERASADAREAIADPGVNAVVIANRHSSHARLAVEALRADKHVFVEKPLALSLEELHAVADALGSSRGSLMAGFNRRFAPHYLRLRDWFQSQAGPGTLVYRVNAGRLPAGHWVMDVREGGRFLGELCHYIDLAMDLCGAPLTALCASSPEGAAGGDMCVLLEFEGGLQASLNYSSAGHRRVGRERLEAFRGEGAAVLDNFTRLEISTAAGRKTWRSFGAQRGHREELRQWVHSVSGRGAAPLDARSLFASAEANLLALHSALTGQRITAFEY